MDTNWSISLEHDDYERNLELVVQDAIEAVERTTKGFYVNLVTPAAHGNPEDYLAGALISYFHQDIQTKYIDQCGCGGFVFRVWKNN
jgi:putative CGCGG family rSAM target protein